MTNNRRFTDISNQQLNKSVEDKDELDKASRTEVDTDFWTFWQTSIRPNITYHKRNGSAQVLLNLKKQQSNNPWKSIQLHQLKLGMLNLIEQIQHFNLCNMMCYGALESNIERDIRP